MRPLQILQLELQKLLVNIKVSYEGIYILINEYALIYYNQNNEEYQLISKYLKYRTFDKQQLINDLLRICK